MANDAKHRTSFEFKGQKASGFSMVAQAKKHIEFSDTNIERRIQISLHKSV